MELQTVALTKRYGAKTAVDHFDLTLRPGVTALLGANGAGKTTLMRLLCALQKPTSGHVLLDGRDVLARGDEYRAQLGYLPQPFGYYPDFTAGDFLRYLAALKGLTPRESDRRAGELLENVGLSDVSRRAVKTFSGGMKQRLGIAQALLNDPRFLILDEPTAGLDPKERVRFRNLISALSRERTVLLSTHIVSDVESIADQLVLMKDGRLLHQGTPRTVTAELEGQVWECRVPSAQVEEYEARWTVSNVRPLTDGGTLLRVVAPQPPTSDAAAAPPTLEDLYLSYFGGGPEA